VRKVRIHILLVKQVEQFLHTLFSVHACFFWTVMTYRLSGFRSTEVKNKLRIPNDPIQVVNCLLLGQISGKKFLLQIL